MGEADFRSTAGDMGKWLQYNDVQAVYHSQYSPLLRAVVQLGACCHVNRGVPRRYPTEGFDLAELKQSAVNVNYLRASDGDPTGACNILSIYASGTASRGVLGVVAAHEQTGLLVLVRPRGTAISEQSRATMQSHEAAAQLNLSLDSVDSWDAALGRLQRLLPGLQRLGKGRAIALVQTEQPLAQLRRAVPALNQMPTVAVPYSRADGAWNEPVQLGGAWQPEALKLALDRLVEQSAWWVQRLDLARCAQPSQTAGARFAFRDLARPCCPARIY